MLKSWKTWGVVAASERRGKAVHGAEAGIAAAGGAIEVVARRPGIVPGTIPGVQPPTGGYPPRCCPPASSI